MNQPEFKQPPPPYSAEPPPAGFNIPQQSPYPPATNVGYPYPPSSQQGQPPFIVPPTTTTTITMQPPTQVVLINGCPNCRAGVLEDEYSCCGIFCAIFCFPLGLLCCLLMRERRCTNCRAVF